ncbi:MAG: ABC transporter ATP-binding protein [Pseudomonadota bacterium]|uniref:ABC transporter ATP-binding protein n=1 Tax=Candidatus Desulfatibia profunda TaxID=2841695 RepID=A0A8J6NX77_9BACT|nr:ABC transporter ATP-binding protein [Candidatus Desulfatibia profunda]MBL7180553.1 ABC transporter ATP-binding protein [Desulfobacterales bacterium]
MTNNTLLSVEDLKVYFRAGNGVARAVDGVSFQVRRQETVCLVGESGCGKTVSALSILGLNATPPAEIAGGRIVFNGQNLLGLDEEKMRKIRGNQIAMVFQEPLTSLNPVFTIGDQIGEAVSIHENISVEALHERCVQLLKDVGFPAPRQRLKDYPHQLSGGQRQRVMIAMALACAPELIIADEPTTALDVTVQAQILDLFRSIQKERSMSVLYITHDLGVVANIAERVYVMYAGIIAEQGNTSQIFHDVRHPYTRGLLASLPSRVKRGKRLYSIPGAVPNPAHKPGGCPFHPRCPDAVPVCREELPQMCDYGAGHLARCPVLFERNN